MLCLVRAPAVLLLALSALACGGGGAGPTPPEIPAGVWVGEGVRATVTAEGASLVLDCAGAAIAPPLALDAQGRFDLAGWWEHRGGPEPYTRREARFGGRLHADRLTLVITLAETAETRGPYELALGARGRPPVLCR